jgi:hypothetical protein
MTHVVVPHVPLPAALGVIKKDKRARHRTSNAKYRKGPKFAANKATPAVKARDAAVSRALGPRLPARTAPPRAPTAARARTRPCPSPR